MTALVLIALAAGLPQARAEQPSFTFGVLADVQYADRETLGARRYRESLGKLQACAEALAAEKPAFTVQLGDLVDGGLENLERVLPLLGAVPGRVYSVLGNHDFCAPRPTLLKRLGMPAAHYRFTRPGWRFLALDGMAESVIGWPEGDRRRAQGAARLETLKAAGERNAQPWNGGLGAAQRRWLEGELAAAHKAGERVIAFCHFPTLAESCRPEHLLWDHRETLAILDAAPALAAWINGHDHRGGYAERRGVHYVTLRGVVEHAPPEGCQTIDVFPRRLELRAAGAPGGRTLALK